MSTVIGKMSLEPPSKDMERKAKEIEFAINKIKQDKIDTEIQNMV